MWSVCASATLIGKIEENNGIMRPTPIARRKAFFVGIIDIEIYIELFSALETIFIPNNDSNSPTIMAGITYDNAWIIIKEIIPSLLSPSTLKTAISNILVSIDTSSKL